MSETPRPLRIAIADDHALFRQGLRSMLALEEGITVVGEVDRVGLLPGLLEETPPDVLLLDLQMDRSSLAEIEALAARVSVVVVTASERPEDALGALRAGARAVVFKRFAIETLMTAIAAVTEGHVWMPPALQAQLTTQLRTPVNRRLTSREREIVRHVALGMRNAEVARQLFISEVTVKTHLNNVFQKLGVRDRVELTLYAIRAGIVGANEERG
ncbi:MAG TPA: response regulator transcription factor [Myxococcota bacterium]|nr:response regulator transcription factor [Myxococcota bacterium]